MGFSTLLDIVGSVIIGGLILLILFRLNNSATANLYNSYSEATVQQSIVSVVQVLESDFRKIGYCKDWNKIPDPTKAILYADTSKFVFLTDIDNDGNVDTLDYYLGPTSMLSNTPNPRDRLLYRVVNNETPRSANVGLTEFKITYYNSLGDTIKTLPLTSNTGQIHTIQIDVETQNSEAMDSTYVTSFWRQIKLSAKNLQNR
jgi:type II secretory pathway component PulJ